MRGEGRWGERRGVGGVGEEGSLYPFHHAV